jgi:hypothetical protein
MIASPTASSRWAWTALLLRQPSARLPEYGVGLAGVPA